MRTREIEHSRWPHFLDDFSQLHRGKHVSVETMVDRHAGAGNPRLIDQPLLAIVMAGDTPDLGERIEVIADGPSASHRTHCVTDPQHVWVGEEEGWIIALQIESGDGSQTILRFEPPREGMLPGFTIA